MFFIKRMNKYNTFGRRNGKLCEINTIWSFCYGFFCSLQNVQAVVIQHARFTRKPILNIRLALLLCAVMTCRSANTTRHWLKRWLEERD